MNAIQQELPLPRWGGARRGAGRKRLSPRTQFRRAALHVTLRMRREVWNLRTHRCFRALQRAFADRYHAHVLSSPREAFRAVRYVLENWTVHAAREGEPPPSGVDPYCSTAWREHGPPLVAQAEWWMLRVGVRRTENREIHTAA